VLPTSEQGVPDFVLTEGQLVPRVQALYGLAVTGRCASMLRFDAKHDARGVVGLSELVAQVLTMARAGSAGFTILAEAAGVVGAALRRSPATTTESPLTFPAVREWLSFTTERSNERQIALIVGVAARTPSPELAEFVRPIAPGSDIHVHLHAAVFPYRPVQRGALELDRAVSDLITASSPTAVLHLLADTRTFEGVGETDLMRGACWFGPLVAHDQKKAH
jgi:hypothetical protein